MFMFLLHFSFFQTFTQCISIKQLDYELEISTTCKYKSTKCSIVNAIR